MEFVYPGCPVRKRIVGLQSHHNKFVRIVQIKSYSLGLAKISLRQLKVQCIVFRCNSNVVC